MVQIPIIWLFCFNFPFFKNDKNYSLIPLSYLLQLISWTMKSICYFLNCNDLFKYINYGYGHYSSMFLVSIGHFVIYAIKTYKERLLAKSQTLGCD